jgi:hypothetical protein
MGLDEMVWVGFGMDMKGRKRNGREAKGTIRYVHREILIGLTKMTNSKF